MEKINSKIKTVLLACILGALACVIIHLGKILVCANEIKEDIHDLRKHVIDGPDKN